jgi:hypothetical protein
LHAFGIHAKEGIVINKDLHEEIDAIDYSFD